MSIKKRAVFYIGGYDPKSPHAFYDRLEKECGRFSKLWHADVVPTDEVRQEHDITIQSFKTEGIAWKTRTTFHFLNLDDIVLRDFAKPVWTRTLRSLVTTTDYVMSGMAWKFLRHAWRFFLYFCYPPVSALLTLLLCIGITAYVAIQDFAYAPLAAAGVFVFSFWGLIELFWKRKYVLHLMDLWSFSRDFIYRSRSDIDQKLDRFADMIVSVAGETRYDEIILIGHSTGGALILDAAARAREKDPELTGKSANIQVLTVGSTALKIGMHPKAGWYRDRLKTCFADTKMRWCEYQCHTDVINLYKTDPAALMSLNLAADVDGNKRPIVNAIRVKDMVDKATYKRISGNFFRVHYQFVFGNTRSYHYDFPAICFGPASLKNRATKPNHFLKSILGE